MPLKKIRERINAWKANRKTVAIVRTYNKTERVSAKELIRKGKRLQKEGNEKLGRAYEDAGRRALKLQKQVRMRKLKKTKKRESADKEWEELIREGN